MRVAITGGTGFVGGHLIAAAIAAGHRVQALTRRPQPPGGPREAGPAGALRWIDGALDRPDRLAALVAGADAVIHVAGVINGDRAAFAAGNVAGTEALLAAAAEARVRRFVFVSSLAAREPALSSYGWSKHAAEDAVIASGGDWTIVRPPAIYGPGDREMLELFRAARLGLVPLPPGGRLSVIAVEDLCDLLLACLAAPGSVGRLYEPDDGRDGGWSHRDFAAAIGAVVGRRIVALPLPRPLLRAGAAADRTLRGRRAKLTRDRIDYFCHPDWTARPGAQPPAELWRPRIATADGLAATARWYREAGWLKR